MELLKTFILPEEGIGNKRTRESCRAIVFDEDGLIPLILVSKKNYHKLPGGGVESGEDKIETLKREFLEETGCEIDVTKEIGRVVESNSIREHTSYCYIANIVSKGVSNPMPEEVDRGYQLIWRTIDEAISLLENDIPNDTYGDRIVERDLFILKKAKEIVPFPVG